LTVTEAAVELQQCWLVFCNGRMIVTQK